MRLTDVRDAITALDITRPWGFDGAVFVETLTHVNTTWGPIAPPFTLDLALSDSFLLVRHVGHAPYSAIDGFRSIEDLELAILSSFTNNFVSHCVAFIGGKPSLFRILFRDESGAEVELDKEQQLQEDDFGRQYPGCRIEWM